MVEHPVIRTHPETGRRCIYVNAAFTQYIVGWDKADSDAMLKHLYAQAAIPEYQCRFRWEPGSIAFWDNRASQHYAASDYWPAVRRMERVTIVGDRPR
jgi:taurine dioxygenase